MRNRRLSDRHVIDAVRVEEDVVAIEVNALRGVIEEAGELDRVFEIEFSSERAQVGLESLVLARQDQRRTGTFSDRRYRTTG